MRLKKGRFPSSDAFQHESKLTQISWSLHRELGTYDFHLGSPRLARGSIATKDAGGELRMTAQLLKADCCNDAARLLKGARLSAIGRMALRDKRWAALATLRRTGVRAAASGSSQGGTRDRETSFFISESLQKRHPGRHDPLDLGTQVPATVVRHRGQVEWAEEGQQLQPLASKLGRAAIARNILGPGATALQEDLGYKRTEIHVENLLQGLAQVLYSEPEDDDAPDAAASAERQKPLALRGAAQAPEAAADLDWGSLLGALGSSQELQWGFWGSWGVGRVEMVEVRSDNSRQAIKQWVAGQLGGRHCMLVLEQGCAETLLLPSASETLATCGTYEPHAVVGRSDLRGGAVLNVLSGLFAEVLEEALEQCLREIGPSALAEVLEGFLFGDLADGPGPPPKLLGESSLPRGDPRVDRVSDLSPDQASVCQRFPADSEGDDRGLCAVLGPSASLNPVAPVQKPVAGEPRPEADVDEGADAAAVSASSDECTKVQASPASSGPKVSEQPNKEKRCTKALAVLHEALSAQAPSGPSGGRSGNGHPWVCEFLAWQLETALSEEVKLTGAGASEGPPMHKDVASPEQRSYRARLRRLLQGLRLEANRPLVAKLFEGKLSPQEFLSAEEGGALLPAEMRERRRQLEEEAAERAAAEARAVRAASALPFFSEKIQCQGCSNWGVRYDRIPHAGGHHKLGKTAGLGGTDYARLVVQCEKCGLSWRTDEPP
ncbi:hypothetical protein AK812_SmicGene29867 [Symbiodinium microadriaticum]|uniref:TFIIS central domain-containing protein n=1 Tax=Symbiodinium microadriaticum TaxID=2951 RepID=A0A1Q9D0N7_SYMMI|nr:hypothetical protein AK812_SmicGene29867 [Symbiodinium microadriaticum]